MKTIKLTQGKVALVDDVDYDWLNQRKWFAMRGNSPYLYYAVRGAGGKHNQKRESMHRAILGLQYFTNDKRQTDHIDGDGLNNQRSNLRVCTITQNYQSSRKRKVGTSKYKGVYWDQGKWRADIQANKKRIHLGSFDSETDAARAYDLAALKYHHNFAITNKMLRLIP